MGLCGPVKRDSRAAGFNCSTSTSPSFVSWFKHCHICTVLPRLSTSSFNSSTRSSSLTARPTFILSSTASCKVRQTDEAPFAHDPTHACFVLRVPEQAVKLDARRLEFPHCFRTPAEVSVFLAAARKLLPTLPSSVDGNAKIPRTVCPPAVFATDAKQSPKLSPAKVAASVRRSGRSRRRRPADVQGEAKPCAASAPAAKAAAAKAKRADAPCEPAAPVASSALRILNPARIEAAPMSPSLTPRDADDDAEPDVRVVRATRSSRRAPARKRVAPHSSPALETCSKGKRRRRGPFPTWPSQSPRDSTTGRPALTVDVPAIVPPFGMESLLSPGDSDFSDGFPDVCTVPGDDEFMLPPLDDAAMELFARDVASLPACPDSSVDVAPVPAGMLPIPASHEFWPACDVYTNADVLEPMPTATLWSLLGARTS